MLRQSPSRNQRSKGFKLKSVLQICVLLVICIWLLYQVKHFRDSMANKQKSAIEISEKVRSGHETKRLGRKGLHPQVKEKFPENEIHEEGKEVLEEGESRAEGNGDDARAAGDDEMDARDQDRLEEEEEEEEREDEEEEEEEEASDHGDDFVDDDDKDREEESEK